MVAMNDSDGATTSSPGPIPAAMSARCSAVVHEDTATACPAPSASANAASNRATRGPCATQPEATAAAAAGGGRDVGQPPGHPVDAAGRPELRLQVTAHDLKEHRGELAQAGLGPAADVEDLAGHVAVRGEQVGPGDVLGVHEVHRLQAIA